MSPARQTLLRLRRLAAGLGALAALWTWLLLPALHVLEHAREDDEDGVVETASGHHRPLRLQNAIAHLLYPDQPHRPGHRHSHGSTPGQGDHGDGAIQHFGVAFLDAPAFVVSPPAATLVLTAPSAPCAAPATVDPRRAHRPRGPPRSLRSV